MARNSDFKRFIAAGIVFAFLGSSLQPCLAQELILPQPGTMVDLSPVFNPPVLKGIKVYPDNPFRFDFILDKGDSKIAGERLKDESTRLIKYFLTSLTIPEKDLWVNLSPYEKDRIIPASFGLTEMGRDLLAEDYMLKQITASLIYPEGDTGKKFWKRVYEESARKFGTTDIPVNTYNKVWVVPQKAVVYENAQAATAFVVDSKLKVMLEEDYLSLKKHETASPAGRHDVHAMGSQIIREIVIPELTREVNEDRNFSPLRQVYDSLILAAWYKKKIKDSILARVYSDQNKVAGVGLDDPQEKERIYQNYIKAFKKGVYNYIKEETDGATHQTVPRRYFSGGLLLTVPLETSQTLVPSLAADRAQIVEIMLRPEYGRVMTVPPSVLKINFNTDRVSMWGPPMAGENESVRASLIDLVETDVRDAYVYAALNFQKDQSKDIWSSGVCGAVNQYLAERIKTIKGIGFEILTYVTENKTLSRDNNYHKFMIIYYQGHVWILDLTWQQFLNRREISDSFPKALLVDVALIDRKLDIMNDAKARGRRWLPEFIRKYMSSVLKDNRHYWSIALSNNPDTLRRIRQESLYNGFSPVPPQYYQDAKSRLTPKVLFHVLSKYRDSYHSLNQIEETIGHISLDANGLKKLVAVLADIEKTSSGKTKELYHEAYLNYQLELEENLPSRPRSPVTGEMAGSNTGGIDLTPAEMDLQTRMDPRLRGDGGIRFNFDPAMTAQLQKTSGFVPVIVAFRPMSASLRDFLGITKNPASSPAI
jgi:hypothetical protein